MYFYRNSWKECTKHLNVISCERTHPNHVSLPRLATWSPWSTCQAPTSRSGGEGSVASRSDSSLASALRSLGTRFVFSVIAISVGKFYLICLSGFYFYKSWYLFFCRFRMGWIFPIAAQHYHTLPGMKTSNKCVWMQVGGSNCPDMIIVNRAIVAEMHNCSVVSSI